MSTSIWKSTFAVPVAAGVLVDKLLLARDDTWALATRLTQRRNNPFLSALLWSLPQLGSSQLMIDNFVMGEPRAYGVIVGDGQIVTSLNPLLTEWLFCRRVVPSGSCMFAATSSERTLSRREKQETERLSSQLDRLLEVAGPPVVISTIVVLTTMTSISYFSAAFIGCLYLSTVISNVYLASQIGNSWAGYTKDTEQARMLILAPDDRWAVLHGPRNLIKMATTGSHASQRGTIYKTFGRFMLLFGILAAGLLSGATPLDGVYIASSLAVIHTISWVRAMRLENSMALRGVRIGEPQMRSFRRRADLVGELSETAMSDVWAYESGLLSRRYVPENSKLANDE